ncbi:hypothetical protein [Sphingobacterium bovisgrunnientis]|uniref:hypothetical protein n=1 Tax=Sphingobacterium bovisgrunnientis TaxID=1874697 RepID=UPI001865794B|nr:hypothetical protein [Sphingobacterium bovisgrunnientis]
MKLNKNQRNILKEKYQGRCAYCGDLLGDRWHADRIEGFLSKFNLLNSKKDFLI